MASSALAPAPFMMLLDCNGIWTDLKCWGSNLTVHAAVIHLLAHVSLFCSAVLHFEFRAWCQQGKHQSCHAAAFGCVLPRDVSSTTYSHGEKCYYKKGWLLCDSHCFIKKIFSPKQISVKKSKGFPKPQQNRTAHNSIFHRSATSLEIHTQTQKMFIFT